MELRSFFRSIWFLCLVLLYLFITQRVLGGGLKETPMLTGVGLLALAGVLVAQVLAFVRAQGDLRRIERILLISMVGSALGVVLYFVGAAQADAEGRLAGVLAVAWPTLIGVSLIPGILVQISVGLKPRAAGASFDIEVFRVVEAGASGLSIALAAASLFLICYVAAERDKSVDVGYFKTSAPGTATQNMVSTLDKPLDVLVFFPEVNDVKDEVLDYFHALSQKTHNVNLAVHDRVLDVDIAKKYRVTQDAVIVLARGEQQEKITLNTDLDAARTRLRTLDEDVQKAFMKIARKPRIAYLTTGHGEMNDPATEGPLSASPLNTVNTVKQMLGILNYTVRDLGLKQGLGDKVPDDAILVLSLGPKHEFAPEETNALDRYLAKGGAFLAALDPASEARFAGLSERLGVTYNRTPLANDQQHLARRRDASDNGIILTDQFSSHASVTTLSRARSGAAIVLVSSGSFDEVSGTPATTPKRTHVVRSLPNTFADQNGNFTFDEGGEKRLSYNLVTAVEKAVDDPDAASAEPPASAKPVEGEHKPPEVKKKAPQMRAMLFADAEMFSDALVLQVQLNGALIFDSIKWLGGEEAFSGETISEKDVPIEHTQSEDKRWFYSTIFGAPFLLLAIGLGGVFRARRRAERKA